MAKIAGQHRNLALAERHLRAIQKEFPGARITSRRNALGKFSTRGQFFTFEYEEETIEPPIPPEPPEPPDEPEWGGAVDSP